MIEPSSADFDSDGRIDGIDFVTWQENFPILADATQEQGDANGDGAVGNEDLLAWQAAFGEMNGAAVATTAVPEPSAVAIVAAQVFTSALLRRRVRRVR